jgi:hypothetical protein
MSAFADFPRITPFLWFNSNAEEAVEFYLTVEPLAKYPAHLGEIAFFAALIERCVILGRERNSILALRAHFRHAATCAWRFPFAAGLCCRFSEVV